MANSILRAIKPRPIQRLGQGQGGDTHDASGRDAQTVIRIGAGQSQQSLHRVEAVHRLSRVLGVVILDTPTIGKITNVLIGGLFRAEKIAVERQDRLSLVEFVIRLDRLAKGDTCRLFVNRKVDRLIFVEIHPLDL